MSLQDRLTELRDQGLADIKSADALKKVNPVSYTHLTLPTKA